MAPQIRHNVCIIGPHDAGKTAVVRMLTGVKEYKNIPRTVGIDVTKIDIEVDGDIAPLELHDTEGCDVLAPLIKPTLRHAKAIIVVYDSRSFFSFNVAKSLAQEAVKVNGHALVVFMGTRREKQQFEGHKVKAIALANSIHQKGEIGSKALVALVSGKTGENVKNTFREITKKMDHRDAVDTKEEALGEWENKSITSFAPDEPLGFVDKSKGKFRRGWKNFSNGVQQIGGCGAKKESREGKRSPKRKVEKPHE